MVWKVENHSNRSQTWRPGKKSYGSHTGMDRRCSLTIVLVVVFLVDWPLRTSVGENVCNNSQIRKKSCSFGFWKNLKKRTGHLMTQPLIHNHRKSVPVSRQHQTFCQKCGHKKLCNWELCEINAYKFPQHSGMFSNGSERNTLQELGSELVITERISMWTQFDGLRTKLLLTTFYDFLIHHFQKK